MMEDLERNLREEGDGGKRTVEIIAEHMELSKGPYYIFDRKEQEKQAKIVEKALSKVEQFEQKRLEAHKIRAEIERRKELEKLKDHYRRREFVPKPGE